MAASLDCILIRLSGNLDGKAYDPSAHCGRDAFDEARDDLAAYRREACPPPFAAEEQQTNQDKADGMAMEPRAELWDDKEIAR
jgi:hypothetical protein